MAYADKRDGRLTGSWVGEAPKLRKKRRFKTKQEAQDYETFVRLMGREPPTIEDGHEGTGAPTFAEVAKAALAAGGPNGAWKRERDPSLVQRVEHCVGVIGAYEIQRVTRSVLAKIGEDLDKRGLAPATINRYLNCAGAVLTYAVNEEIIPGKPKTPLRREADERQERDILQPGQEEVVLRLMRMAGHTADALCVEVLLETGMRRGELEKLGPDQITIEQVEDETGTPVLVGAIRLRKDQTKNNRARLVIFSADLARQIKALIGSGSAPKGYQMLRHFKRACKHAGYGGNLVIHSLRHTRNTRMFDAGVEEAQRMEIMGHSSETVNRIYTHQDVAAQLRAVKKVQESAGKKAQKPIGTPSQVIDFPRTGT